MIDLQCDRQVSSSRGQVEERRRVRWRSVSAAALLVLSCAALAGAEESPDTLHYRVELYDEAPYFEPKRLRVELGGTVTWENHGAGLIHTVRVATEAGVLSSGPLMPGESWSHSFDQDAVIKASCEIHPYMYGIVIVGEPPASLISAMESQVELPGSPGVSIEVVEYPLPIPGSVPGILAVDAQDNVWVTMGGGGWAHIAHPPLNRFARLTLDGDITIYSTPTEVSGPSGLLVAADGTVYITELMAGKIARFEPHSQRIEEFPIPTEPAWPTGLDLADDGALWFSQTKGNKIGRLSPEGVIREISVPTEGAHPTGLDIDSRGNVWIAERDRSKIGCLKNDGTFVEYAIPTPRAKPAGILVDRHDRVWFAEREGNRIGVLVEGRIREYPLPNPRSGPFFLAEDANGWIWFSEVFGNRIGALHPETGRIAEFAVPTPDSWPGGIAFDSQGGLWFTEQLGNKVGYISNPSQALSSFFDREEERVAVVPAESAAGAHVSVPSARHEPKQHP